MFLWLSVPKSFPICVLQMYNSTSSTRDLNQGFPYCLTSYRLDWLCSQLITDPKLLQQIYSEAPYEMILLMDSQVERE